MNIVLYEVTPEIFDNSEICVTVLDHPMAKPRIETVPAGMTAAEIECRFAAGRDCALTADGRRIPLEERPGTIVNESAQLVCVPGKGVGPFFRQVLGLLIAVVASVVAPYLLGAIAPGLIGTTAGALLTGAITAGITISGSLLLNALFPVGNPRLGQDDGSATYSIGGGRNRINPYGALPDLLGTHRVAPNYAASPFTELVGDDQFFTIMVCWGYGPIELEQLKIGETDLDEFDEVTIENRVGYATDDPPSLFPNQVIEEQLNVELEPFVESVRTTMDDTDRIVVDVQAPNGIFVKDNKGRYIGYGVTIRIEYRLNSALPSDPWTLHVNERIAGQRTKAIRKSYSFDVPRGKYDVRIQRTQNYHLTETIPHESLYWTAIRSVTNESPVNPPAPLALTTLRIKASSQLSGAIETFNAVAKKLVKSWNGTAWVDNQVSSNPADLFRHVLQGPANKRPVPDSLIDLDTLQDWHDFCRINGYTFNMYRDFVSSVWDTLADICAAGRANRVFLDGKWSVIWEDASAPVVQHFTPANSSNFKSSRGYSDKIQALRIRFVDAQNSYEEDERLVFADGYDETNTTRYEVVEFPGITDRDLIYKHGRYHIAQHKLRREVYELTTDFEHLACTRGSRVRLTHDVLKVGLDSGRVKAVNGDTVTLTSEIAIEADKSYVIRFRTQDGGSSLRNIATLGPALSNTISLVPDATQTAPNVGDLWMYGEVGKESIVCRVYSIKPADKLSATLELVDDAPEIQNADTGTIPAFNPNISQPIDLRQFPPRDLSGIPVLEVVDGTIVASVNLSWVSPAAAGIRNYLVQHKPETGDWSTPVEVVDTSIVVSDLDSGKHFFRVKSVFADTISTWSAQYEINIDGPSKAPADVAEFRAIVSGTNLILSWSAVIDTVFRDYEIRHTSDVVNPTWATATPLRTEFVGNALTIPYLRGSFLIRARSWNDIYSANPAIVIVNVTPISEYNVVETVNEMPPFSGQHNGTAFEHVYNAVVLANDADFFSPADFFEPADMFRGGVRVLFGVYELGQRIDLTAEMTVRMSSDIVAGGVKYSDNFFDRTDFFAADDFFGNDPSLWNVIQQIRMTSDDPNGAPVWSAWQDFVVGDYTARAFEFRLLLSSQSADLSPLVTTMKFTADVPDRIIAFEDIPSGAGAYQLQFNPPFFALKDLQITAQDMQTGDYWTVTGKSANGATVAFFDQSNNPISRTFDAHAFGYGSLQ